MFLATDPSVAGVSGRYFVRRRSRGLQAAATDGTTAARLWDVSAELVGL